MKTIICGIYAVSAIPFLVDKVPNLGGPSDAIFYPGTCPTIQGMPGFDVTKYMNRWWNIGNSPFLYASDGSKCGYADYHLESDEDSREYIKVANYDVQVTSPNDYSVLFGAGYPNMSDPAAGPSQKY